MRWLVALLTLLALAGAMGCGEEKTVPDGQIVQALKLEPDSDNPVYAIGGDAFCEVDQDLLNNETEVGEAKSEPRLEGLVITDQDQSVGVQAVPPFDPSCERSARKALDNLGDE